MWLFTQDGFVSVVAYDPAKDRNPKSDFRNIATGPETHLLLRARILADLDTFKKVDPELWVETDELADYAYRAVITRKKFKTWMKKQVDALDYDSHFKEVTRDRAPKSSGRYSAMMAVWGAMNRLQPMLWHSSKIDGYWDDVDAFLDAGGRSTAVANAKPKVYQPHLPGVGVTGQSGKSRIGKGKAGRKPWQPGGQPQVTAEPQDASFRFTAPGGRKVVPASVDTPIEQVDVINLAFMMQEKSLVQLNSETLFLSDDALELWFAVEEGVDHGDVDGTRPLSEEEVDRYVAEVDVKEAILSAADPNHVAEYPDWDDITGPVLGDPNWKDSGVDTVDPTE